MRISIELLEPETWEDEYGTQTVTHLIYDMYPSSYYTWRILTQYVHLDFLNQEVTHYPEVTIPETTYNEGTEWEYTEPEYVRPAFDYYRPRYVENGIDMYNPENLQAIFNYTVGNDDNTQFALGKLNTLMSSFMYFPKNNKYDLLFDTERDSGYLIRNNEVSGIAGCDGTFFIETGINTRISVTESNIAPFNFERYRNVSPSVSNQHNPRLEDTFSHYTSHHYYDVQNGTNTKNRFTNIDEFLGSFNGEGGGYD